MIHYRASHASNTRAAEIRVMEPRRFDESGAPLEPRKVLVETPGVGGFTIDVDEWPELRQRIEDAIASDGRLAQVF